MELYQVFEGRFAEWNGLTIPVVACASGTAALHLALASIGLPKGSIVLVPDFTMVACARAVSLAGLIPRFVGCTTDLLIDPDAIDEAMTDNVSAVMAVHIYGRRCDMSAIADLSDKYQIAVIEDLAEAHGIYPHRKTHAACWSHYRNKVIAGEEGGAVWFSNPAAASLARQLRSLGFTDSHDFMHIPGGMNYRMSNCHARLILDSLDMYKSNISTRRVVEGWYDEDCPKAYRMPTREVPWVYDIKVPGMTTEIQNRLVANLLSANIGARHGFKPMHIQEEYKHCKVIRPRTALTASREVIYLPLQPGIGWGRNGSKIAFEVINRTLG